MKCLSYSSMGEGETPLSPTTCRRQENWPQEHGWERVGEIALALTSCSTRASHAPSLDSIVGLTLLTGCK